MRFGVSPRDLIDCVRVCAAQKDLSQAKLLYANLVHSNHKLDKFTINQLMRMFGKCGSPENAHKLFDEIPFPDTAQWNIIVTAYAINGHFNKAKLVFDKTPRRDIVSWNTLCQNFVWSHKIDDLEQCLLKMPCYDIVAYNIILSAYAPNGHILEVFDGIPERDIISWNTAISHLDLDKASVAFALAPQRSLITWNVLISRHHSEESKGMFDSMPSRDIVSWNSLMDVAEIDQAQKIFSRMASHDAISWITITTENAQSGHVDRAMELFNRAPCRSLVLWNVILSGISCTGDLILARSVLGLMPRVDVISWNSLLGALLEFSTLDDAAEFFAAMPQRNLSSWTLLVGGFSQYCRSPRAAAGILLERMPQWDPVPWNAALSAMAKAGDAAGSKDLFDRTGNHRNAVTWTILCEINEPWSNIPLDAYSKMPQHCTAAVLAAVAANAHRQRWATARYLFEGLRHRIPGTWNAYLALCVVQPGVAKPASVLSRMPQWNAVSWNTIVAASRKNFKLHMDPDEEQARLLIEMTTAASDSSSSFSSPSIELATTLIVAHALNGDTASARAVFEDTARRDVVAWTAMLTGSSLVGDVGHAAAVHRVMPAWNVVCWNALVSAYSQNGHTAAAQAAFAAMPERNLRSWNCILAALVQNEQPRMAIDLFEKEMDLVPNEVTLTTLLDACGELGDLEMGIALQDRCVDLHLDRHNVVATALLDMYARCGRADLAKKVFDSIPGSIDLVSWNAMIAGFARNGQSAEALLLYDQLERHSQLKPDASTFAAVIDACCSAVPPAVREGRAIHQRVIACGMDRDPVVGSSLVALYTRAGGLEAARRCFDRISAKNTVVWNSMLVGFANHGDAAAVIESFHSMQLDGSIADAVTFVAVFASCAHAGWIVEAGQFFHFLASDFFVAATPEHYSAIGDLLGRLGRIGDAGELVEAKPYEASGADWMSLLSACRIHEEIEQGLIAAVRAFELSEVDESSSGTCKLLLGMFSGISF